MLDSLLLHSVSYSGSWGQDFLSLEQFVDKAADLGYGGLMIMAKRPHFSLLDYGEKECRVLRSRIEARRLKNNCFAAYTNFTADLSHGEIPQAELQIGYVMELARAASLIGIKNIRIFTGYEESAASFQAQWALIVKALRETAKRCSEFGVTIGVQNHHDIAVDYRSLADLIDEVNEPNCLPMFDAWAPALQGTDLEESAKAMAHRTVHTTVANYALRPRFRYVPSLVNYEAQTARVQAVPMDEGFIDYRTFFDVMKENGFRGTVAYEMCSPLRGGGSIANLDHYASRFIEFMKPWA